MKKFLTIFGAFTAIAAVFAFIATPANALDQTLPELKVGTVSCQKNNYVDGGTVETADAIHEEIVDQSGRPVGSLRCYNSSTSCVRLTNRILRSLSEPGLLYGDGCAAGKDMPKDVSKAYCTSQGDAGVTVTCEYSYR